MHKIRVAIVEDTDDIRNGWNLILNNTEGFICENTYASAEEAIEQLKQVKPDVVLMDIHLPGMTGIEAIRLLKPSISDTQFLVCSVYEDDQYVFEALKAGATGYILKNSSTAKIISSIEEIHTGGSPMSSSIARRVINTFKEPAKDKNPYQLSDREQDIVQLLAEGYRYKEIGDKLFISIDTVRTHVRKIYEKLQVHSRTEAINKLYQR